MIKLTFLLLVLFPISAEAGGLSLKYDGYWEGIKAGEITFKEAEDGGKYTVTTDVKTGGIVKTLTNFTSHTETTGTYTSVTSQLVPGNVYIPLKYDSAWQTKKNSPHIIVSYAENGEVSEVADPPENRNKRPEVEQQFKQNSFDPITTFFVARNEIRKIIESKKTMPAPEFQVKVFDARRVFNANFKVVGYEDRKIDGVAQKLLHITLNRSVIAGFTKKELEKIKNFNPTFDIYVDDNYIPVAGSGQAVIGRAEIKLVNKCEGDNCG